MPSSPPSRPRLVLVIAGVVAFMSFLDATIVNVAFGDIAASFPGSSRSTLSWVLSAYTIGVAATLVAFGRLGDLLGRRRLFLAGLTVFTASSAACALAPTVGLLMVARAVQALGVAAMSPSSAALLLRATPSAHKVRALGVTSVCAALGSALGPVFGGLLIEASSWRLVFLVNVPIGIATFALAWVVPDESRGERTVSRPDHVGVAALAGAAGLLCLALLQTGAWGWTSTPTVACFAGSALCWMLTAHSCRTHPAPLVEPHLLRLPTFRWSNAAIVPFGAAYFGVTLTNLIFLTEVWGWSVVDAGLAVTPSALVAALVARPASSVAESGRTAAVVAAGAVTFVAGATWMLGQATVHPDLLGVWLPSALLTGAGLGMTMPTLNTAGIAALAHRDVGVGSGVIATSRQLGGVLGVAISIALLGTPDPADVLPAFQRVWLFAAAAGLLCAVAVLPLARLQRPRVDLQVAFDR